MKGSIMRMSWAPRGAFFVAVFAALALATSVAAQACNPGQSYEAYVQCHPTPGALLVTYTCVGTGWWTRTNWRVLWGCGG